MERKRIAIVGAGGFAREVRWLLEEINAKQPSYELVGFVVSDLTKLGPHDSASEVRGDLDWLRERTDQVDAIALGIGNPAVRRSVGSLLARELTTLEWPTLIHPSAVYGKSCSFGKGVLLCAGVIATVNVRIEDFALVNLACTIGHEAQIGEASVLNPDVNVSGGVMIGAETLIGTGAQILQYVKVGEAAKVGAGAVVTKDVDSSTTVVGVPAKRLRDVGSRF